MYFRRNESFNREGRKCPALTVGSGVVYVHVGDLKALFFGDVLQHLAIVGARLTERCAVELGQPLTARVLHLGVKLANLLRRLLVDGGNAGHVLLERRVRARLVDLQRVHLWVEKKEEKISRKKQKIVFLKISAFFAFFPILNEIRNFFRNFSKYIPHLFSALKSCKLDRRYIFMHSNFFHIFGEFSHLSEWFLYFGCDTRVPILYTTTRKYTKTSKIAYNKIFSTYPITIV